ncbi:hypothetical protein KOI35_18470 [Actinoplanes bogorensis]|uniref:Uncharacterized protein n=1 Tax=Paractinoplanes bogorensis TaxID=1610840 RepID=A0ABS5YQX7_9ACTN|nr:hypothetical protein [Actinoplanes bogorensis]MBU2665496.1 hypothetical protein [Actinoplanes bogorensis]
MRRRGVLLLAAGLPFGLRSAPTGLRGRAAGLLAREDHLVRPANQDRLRGLVLRLPWSVVQPEPEVGFSDAATAALDRAEAVAPDAGYPFLKLRLVAGSESPDWALRLGDGPLTGWLDPEDDSRHTVPQWWHDDFLAAYERMLDGLAGALRGRPRWVEATVSATCTLYAEPCVKQLGVAANRDQAVAAGYTDDKDQAALKRAMAAHHRILTPLGVASSVAYNPWQTVADGAVQVSPATTIALMEHQRTTMGPYGVWANNSLSARWEGGEPVQTRSGYEAMYQHMAAAAGAGHPVQFQTATLAKIQAAGGSAYATASWAARHGAVSAELPRGWEQDTGDVIDQGRAGELNDRFAANAARTVSP